MDNKEKKQSTETKEVRSHAFKLPFGVTLIAAIVVVAAFFLPLATANEEYAEYLKKFAQDLNVAEIEMTNEDAIHISMYEFAKMYWVICKPVDKTLATVVVTIISATGILSLVTLLFALLKKPIAIIIFNALTLGAYHLMTWDFKDRGVMPNGNYHWGTAYYLYYIGIVAVFVGAIWLLGAKIKQKHKKRTETMAITEKNLQ